MLLPSSSSAGVEVFGPSLRQPTEPPRRLEASFLLSSTLKGSVLSLLMTTDQPCLSDIKYLLNGTGIEGKLSWRNGREEFVKSVSNC